MADRKITVQFDGQDVGLDSAAKKAATSLDGVETSTAKAGDSSEKTKVSVTQMATAGFGAFTAFTAGQEAISKWNAVTMSGADAAKQVTEAQTALSDAVKTYGKNSPEALKASQDLSEAHKQLKISTEPLVEKVAEFGSSVAAMGAGLGLVVEAIGPQTIAWVAGHTTMAASALASFASQIAEWIVLAATSLASAASVAAAWLLSVAPIALVIIAVVALVVLIVKNWDTIKSVIAAGWHFVEAVSLAVWNGIKAVVVGVITSMVNIVQAQIDMVKSIFRTLVSAIGSIMSGLADTITAPFRNAFGAIKTLWNNSIGGKGFSVPSWIPVIGGKSFTIPYLAQGGIVTQPTLAMIGEAGPEAVVPLDRGGLGGRTVIELRSSGSAIDDMLLELLRKAIRNGGGGTVSVLG